MNIPTYEEANQAVMIGYADAICAFINEHEPVAPHDEIFRSDLQVMIDEIIQNEAKKSAKHYLEIMRDAVEAARADEREACAKLCDEHERPNLYSVKECAAAIRQRGDSK